MNINILKCHGTGNDFILIDEMNNNYSFTEEERKNIAVNLCDRKNSIGADGILFVVKSDKLDAKMRIFNADGSEPEMCGNGLRCVGRYVLEKLNKDELMIETMKAEYKVKKVEDLYEGVKTVEIIIDSITLNVKDLPLVYKKDSLFLEKLPELSDTHEFSAVSVTNPHIVSIVEDIEEEDLVEVGKKANNTPELLPKGVNVNYVKIMDKNNIYVKTFERGVGLTKACGTGMTASCVVVTKAQKCIKGEDINVFNDGGMIKCRVNTTEKGNYYVHFIGNATYVFKGEVDTNGYKYDEKAFDYGIFEEEKIQYEKMFVYTRDVIGK